MQHSIEVAEHRCAQAVQLDMFADLEAATQAAAPNPRAEWRTRFERAPWVAPYDTSSLKAGESVSGWVCPACRKVEVNEFLLNLNHSYDPSIPGRMAGVVEEFGQTCTRLQLLASQARAAASKRDRP